MPGDNQVQHITGPDKLRLQGCKKVLRNANRVRVAAVAAYTLGVHDATADRLQTNVGVKSQAIPARKTPLNECSLYISYA